MTLWHSWFTANVDACVMLYQVLTISWLVICTQLIFLCLAGWVGMYVGMKKETNTEHCQANCVLMQCCVFILLQEEVPFVYLGLFDFCVKKVKIRKDCNHTSLLDIVNHETHETFVHQIVTDMSRQRQEFCTDPNATEAKFKRTSTSSGITLFLFSHESHISSSDAVYENFESHHNCKVELHTSDVVVDCSENDHPFLSPFFNGNEELAEELKKWVQNNQDHHLKKSIQELMVLFSTWDEKGYEFSEDDWTSRLQKSLSVHPSLRGKVEYFDGLKATKFKAIKRKQLKLNFDADCYFHGAPDLYLQNLLVQHREEVEPDLDPMVAEMAAEMASSHVLKFPYPKLGELIANMHIALVDEILKGCLEGKDSTLVQSSVKGMYVDRVVGVVMFAMKWCPTLRAITISRYKSRCRALKENLLCAHFSQIAGIDLHS